MAKPKSMKGEPDLLFSTDWYQVIKVWPHDPKAFTEGLVFHDGVLYESTGGDKRTIGVELSSLRKVEIKTGKILKQRPIDCDHFAEGLTIFGDKIFQLTLRSKKGFIYDLKKFAYMDDFPYKEEMSGWGLTRDGRHLIMSDGSHNLRFIDPVTFDIVDTLPICEGVQALTGLNELEYINGEIFANIRGEDRIVRLDAENGKILGWLDLSRLRPKGASVGDLNGIAHNPENKHLFITGKRWPHLFEIELL